MIGLVGQNAEDIILSSEKIDIWRTSDHEETWDEGTGFHVDEDLPLFCGDCGEEITEIHGHAVAHEETPRSVGIRCCPECGNVFDTY